MKRFFVFLLFVLLAITSIVLGQAPAQATLRTASGEKQVPMLVHESQTFLSAADVALALGASLAADNTGFRITYNNVVAVFGPDSRFGVIRDELIEMPVAPMVVDGTPFVPWQFFDGMLRNAAGLEASWDPAARLLQVRPLQRSVVGVHLSLANVQGTSRIVLTLTAPSEYAIVKEEGALIVRFKSPIRAPFPEQAYDDPNVEKVTFSGSDLRIHLAAPEVVGDAYALDSPFRIVIDLRKGAAPAPGTAPPAAAPRMVDQPGIRTIVIDPGHGGNEVGAIGPNGLMEKDATLTLSKKLASALSAKMGTRVILTREDDSTVSLDQRTAVANQYGADLFLSIHLNAAARKGAHGAETYFLSLEASDELARKAAEAENAAGALSAAPGAEADLKLILWDLAHQEYLHESSRFAQAIQEELNVVSGIESRGVKQAPFKVLVGATMPAALVEVAFISNPDEEEKIQSLEFQTRVVDALTRAVQKYKTDYETRIGIIRPQPPAAAPAAPATTTAAARSGQE